MHVDVFKVPAKTPQLAVNSEVSKFILANNSENGLLIIYYGGHGFRKAGRNTKLVMIAYVYFSSVTIVVMTKRKQ